MYPHGRRGFTLIESLVVVMICAILAAILIPVFVKASEKARQTNCLSNMKQIVLAELQYAFDYDEILPPLKTQPTANVPGDSVFEKLYYPYMKNTALVQCRSDTGTSRPLAFQEKGSPQSGLRPSYGVRYESSRLPIGCIANAKTYALVLELGGPTEIWTPTDKHLNRQIVNIFHEQKPTGLEVQHYDGINVAWADGHCKWKGVDTLFTSFQPDGDMGSGQLGVPLAPKPTAMTGIVAGDWTLIKITDPIPPGTRFKLVHDGVIVYSGKVE